MEESHDHRHIHVRVLLEDPQQLIAHLTNVSLLSVRNHILKNNTFSATKFSRTIPQKSATAPSSC
jgi:hypothetical protein